MEMNDKDYVIFIYYVPYFVWNVYYYNKSIRIVRERAEQLDVVATV